MMSKSQRCAASCWFFAAFLFGPRLLFSKSDEWDRPDRNILLIVTDDESPTLGCYGDPIAKTPAIDAVAADGLMFRNAFATTASCSASRSVMLSGIHNHANGQYGHSHDYHKFAAFHDVVRLSLPVLLKNAGYRTARCGKFHVAPERVFHFDNVIPGDGRSCVQMAENCRTFIQEAASEPFFLYFATNDPHRSEAVNEQSSSRWKPNLFGNKPRKQAYPAIEEVFFEPAKVPVPPFLPDTQESREELAQYYQSCARIDQGVARLLEVLKDADVFDKTFIVFTSDHGMAFAGAKTNVYEPALRVPLIVRNPYVKERGRVTDSLVSHADLTPTLLEFAEVLSDDGTQPKFPIDAQAYWSALGEAISENRRGNHTFDRFHGRSWLRLLDAPEARVHEYVFASHTFHEIQMYYPMRSYRDSRYKLIWNVAHPLEFPFASDLWVASSWQSQWQQGVDAAYGKKTVGAYLHRPKFELFDLQRDPLEQDNLAFRPGMEGILQKYQDLLRQVQLELEDPWARKWDYE